MHDMLCNIPITTLIFVFDRWAAESEATVGEDTVGWGQAEC